MAIRTPLWLQAGSYSAELDRLLMLMFLAPAGAAGTIAVQSGVLPGLGSTMAVTQTTTASMNLQVASGVAAIQGTQTSTQGAYALINDATTNVTVTAASTTNPRIDLVVLQVLDATYSGAQNVGQLAVVPGTPAGSPVAPTLPANSIALARVAVAANASSITSANLTDLRAPTGSRGGYHWGSGAVIPSSLVMVGDTYLHTGLGPNGTMLTNTGQGWRQSEVTEVANLAARTAISTNYGAILHHGFRVYCLDRYVTWAWNKVDAVWAMVEFNGDSMVAAQGYYATWSGSGYTLANGAAATVFSTAGGTPTVGRAANDNFVTLNNGTFTFNVRGRATIMAAIASDGAGNGRTDFLLRTPGAREGVDFALFAQRRGADLIRQTITWTGNVRETNGFYLATYQYSGGNVNFSDSRISIEMH